MIFLDTETCGFTGPIVLIQTAYDLEGKIEKYQVWKNKVSDTLNLLERICNDSVCAFNLTFDWFHINKLYNLFINIENKSRSPIPNEVAEISNTRPKHYCLKPKKALDLFLVARKSKWQVLMNRRDIVIKLVPRELAQQLCQLLNERIQLSRIFFYYRPKDSGKWEIQEVDHKYLVNIALKFAPSSGLKPLVKEIFDEDIVDSGLDGLQRPDEFNYNPYDTGWVRVIQQHISHWAFNPNAQKYAENDVRFLQKLYSLWQPEWGDDDSELACSVGAARWRGFAIDKTRILQQLYNNKKMERTCPVDYNSPPKSKQYLLEVASPTETICIPDTSKKTLQTLETWDNEIGRRAKEIRSFRKKAKETTILQRLYNVEAFCPDFKIIGAKSGRMSGGSEFGFGESINPQGIQRSRSFRALYPLAISPDKLSGGDFEGFEVTIADAAYNDNNLHQELLKGKSFHALLGTLLYNEDYNEIIASKGTNKDHYTPSKNSAFGIFYGAHNKKIAETAQIPEERADLALKTFYARYPKVKEARQKVFDAFCSMRQPKGLGTQIIWRDPAEYIESLLGFRRYFTLENNIVHQLFELAQNLPLQSDGHILRRQHKGIQTKTGATQSALYAAAFALQAYNMRAAANHVIQSTGAEICKHLQRKFWDLQPAGIHSWKIQLLNIHDEIMAVHHPYFEQSLQQVVEEVTEEYRKVVPLLKIDWKTNMKDWSEK